jgi:uncharacterized protein
VLILLPPSEGKTAPAPGRRSVDLSKLSWPELTPARTEVLENLAKISDHPEALARLKVGPSLAAEVQANVRLLTAPAATAVSVYTGVLYDELNFSGLSVRARRRAHSSVLIFSALWGVLRPGDLIPQYRLPMAAKIPEHSSLATFWRQQLTPVLEPLAGGLIVDCRSASYQAAWSPLSTSTEHVLVTVYREIRGRRTVVSHFAKLTRGQLARFLLERPGNPPKTPQALLAAISEEFTAELTPPSRANPRWQLALRAEDLA